MSHAETIRPNTPPGQTKPTHEELMQPVLERFSMGPARLASNGLSTDLLCVPMDLAREHRHLLDEKVHVAMEYATAFVDVEALNTMRYLCEPSGGSYATLGLYLYLADATTRMSPDTTFLTAMREAGAELAIGKTYDRADLLEKVNKALDMAGLGEEQKRVVQEWADKGSFTVAGHPQVCNANETTGAYMELAQNISLRQHFLGMNLAISYALGNKREMAAHASEEDAYTHTQDALANPDKIKTRIEMGNLMREYRIQQVVATAFTPEEIATAATRRKTEEDAGRGMLSHFPDDALKLAAAEHYSFVYTQTQDIRAVFPPTRIPGLKEEDTEHVRGAKGARLDRFRTLFMSDGIRQTPFENEEQRHATNAQTGLHEMMHVALSHIPDHERVLLAGQVRELGDAVRANPQYFNTTHLTTIDTNTLPEVLDNMSGLYRNYRRDEKHDTSTEEVMCNLYGLMHTELKGDMLITQPPQGLEVLGTLSRKLDAVMQQAAHIAQEKAGVGGKPGQGR